MNLYEKGMFYYNKTELCEAMYHLSL